MADAAATTRQVQLNQFKVLTAKSTVQTNRKAVNTLPLSLSLHISLALSLSLSLSLWLFTLHKPQLPRPLATGLGSGLLGKLPHIDTQQVVVAVVVVAVAVAADQQVSTRSTVHVVTLSHIPSPLSSACPTVAFSSATPHCPGPNIKYPFHCTPFVFFLFSSQHDDAATLSTLCQVLTPPPSCQQPPLLLPPFSSCLPWHCGLFAYVYLCLPCCQHWKIMKINMKIVAIISTWVCAWLYVCVRLAVRVCVFSKSIVSFRFNYVHQL